jgi:hypothetical protein
MKTLTGQQTKDNLVVHGNKSTTAKLMDKNCQDISRDIWNFLWCIRIFTYLFLSFSRNPSWKTPLEIFSPPFSQIYGKFRLFSAPLLHLVSKVTIKIHSVQIVDSKINSKATLSEEVDIKIDIPTKRNTRNMP